MYKYVKTKNRLVNEAGGTSYGSCAKIGGVSRQLDFLAAKSYLGILLSDFE